MKTLKYLCHALLLGCLPGCSSNCYDCENNHYFNGPGNLRLIRNWDRLWEGIEKPKEMDVYLYNPFYDLQYSRLTKDTTVLSIANGEYNVLAINNTANISNLGDLSSARISLPRWQVNNKYIVSDAPIIIATSSTLVVEDNTDFIIAPEHIVSIINFRFIFIQNDTLMSNIKKCNAELNGVITSRLLSGKKDKEDIFATLQFETEQSSKGIYCKKAAILGLSGYENTLEIAIVLNDGEIKNTIIDLTNHFDFSLSPVQNCIIRLSVNDDSNSAIIKDITIEAWEEGTNDNIEIQNN